MLSVQKLGRLAVSSHSTGPDDSIVTLFDVHDNIKSLKAFSISGVAVAADFIDSSSSCVISSASQGFVIDTAASQCIVGVLDPSGHKIHCQAINSSRQVLLGTDAGIAVYDISSANSFSTKYSCMLDKSGIASLCFISDTMCVAATVPQGSMSSPLSSLKVLDLRVSRPVHTWRSPAGQKLHLVPNSHVFTSIDAAGTLHFWDSRRVGSSIDQKPQQQLARKPLVLPLTASASQEQISFARPLPADGGPLQDLIWSDYKSWSSLCLNARGTASFKMFHPDESTGDCTVVLTERPSSSAELAAIAFSPRAPDGLGLTTDGAMTTIKFPRKPSVAFVPNARGALLSVSSRGGEHSWISCPDEDLTSVIRRRLGEGYGLVDIHRFSAAVLVKGRKRRGRKSSFSRDLERSLSEFWRWAARNPQWSETTTFYLGNDEEGKLLSALASRNFQVASVLIRERTDLPKDFVREVQVALAAGALISADRVGAVDLWEAALAPLRRDSRGLAGDIVLALDFADKSTFRPFGDLSTYLTMHEFSSIPFKAALALSAGIEFDAVTQCIAEGLMEGLPVVYKVRGADGVCQLVLRYLMVSMDVQTVTALYSASRAHPNLGLADPLQLNGKFARAVDQYLEILCKWQLWKERSFVSAALGRESQPAVLKCYFCDYSLTGQAGPGAEAISHRCPNPLCHKPLPNCAVCLAPVLAVRGVQVAPPRWTGWCTRCRHGGHQEHLLQWFTDFDECPVAGCDCLCALLDGGIGTD